MTRSATAFFQYRLPRFASSFRLELLSSSAPAVQGHCLNMSETGVLVRLEYPVEEAEEYKVRLVLPSWTVDLTAMSAYVDGCRTGLRFVFHTEQERQFIRAVVSAVASA